MTQLQENPNLERETSTPRRHRFNVAEFEQAHAAGAFGQNRLELIEGELLEMAPMGDAHVDWMGRLTLRFVRAFGDIAMVLPQVPLSLEETESQPEPDFVIVKLSAYQNRKVHAREAAFIVELSDSTLEFDRGPKLRVYARNEVREVWILNIKANELEVYREPHGEAYKSKITLEVGQECSPLEFPDVKLAWWV